ncbi:A/G-specific adenine glycosylase [Allorhodopirellula heiligendammensis]|uniref:Adenine DNA glycosylase n=1 Tax=Allorhodopirellula heiligendammensis TaxID=2714739 RepID=A0A5C6C1I5_9BACT|nr:A/G-specific adenine glycosylase [Allorhodopirellula heiligendammensis]TWU16719.1 A/G-specific adenine glycosylase [Allorhodopirellula heiligendammensis]
MRKLLVDWFSGAARDLPWRRVPSPYRVWVSEIMCQQTQIATVLPYFERFLARYPDATALAKADENELMRMWEGLGYYRRARSMHAAAKQIVADHDGEFPLNYDHAIKLPGIGRYTVGAILSISANQPVPILEGNTLRVFSRLIGLRAAVDEKPSQDVLWKFAEGLLPRKSVPDRTRGPAAINQAAMELGALICTPREPKCLICPLAKCCVAHARGWQAEIPAKTNKIAYEPRSEFAALVSDPSGRWLVRQIPAGSRFAGMWDFPKAGPPEAHTLDEFAQWLATQAGGRWTIGEQMTSMKHAVTRYRITLHVHHATRRGSRPPAPWSFHSADELKHLPMSTTGRRLLDRLTKQNLITPSN